MEKLSKALESSLPGSESTKQSRNETGPERSSTLNQKHIDELWRKLSMLYPHKWTSAVGPVDDGTWFRGLQGIFPQQLAIGLERCAKNPDPWPPSLGQFRALCQPTMEDMGFPELDEAYRLACTLGEGENLPEAVQKARYIIGHWEFRTKPEAEIFPKFKRIYKKVVEDLLEKAATQERIFYLSGGEDGQLYIGR